MTSPTAQVDHCSSRIERVFARCFEDSYQTCLQGGAEEPLYEPSQNGDLSVLYYRHDFFASALHEAAHWCIAGEERRKLTDFGYWYADDGRGESQQKAFESAEYKPQALEWYFSRACTWPFRLSVDNLDIISGSLPNTEDFARRVQQQVKHWKTVGLPPRAAVFYRGLCAEFRGDMDLGTQQFSLSEIL